jgi:hypothetical protein
MKSYFVLCCPGSGGLFLTSALAQLLGYNSDYKISDIGHAHDMGEGNWKGNRVICQVGYHWDVYRAGFPIYYSHVLPEKFLDDNQHIQTIYIDVDHRDRRKVTELYVRKAWPDIWTPDEYMKWASPEYPPYSRDNIEKSLLIQTDLINDFENTTIRKWHNENPSNDSYKRINFRTIMGLDDNDLLTEICRIVGKPPTDKVRQYVSDYQQLNKKLYFADW